MQKATTTPDGIRPVADVIRVQGGVAQPPDTDLLAVEEPLEIRLRGQGIVVTMRTPGHDEELAAGFLFSEGVIRDRADLVEIAPCAQATPETRGNVLNVFLAPNVTLDLKALTRHAFTSSSCGVCGKATLESVRQIHPDLEAGPRLEASVLVTLPDRLREAQAWFARTGALHAAGLFTPAGEPTCVREDVGRHNAVDKVIGRAWLDDRWPLKETVLVVSGRISFEIVQKALAARIPILIAVSAPSTLAVDLARDSGMTLAGFTRDGRFNLYSRPDRVSLG